MTFSASSWTAQILRCFQGRATPISINNVNGGNPFPVQTLQNAAFFHNNDLSDGGPFYFLNYDGFTDVFTLSALGLGAGSHTIAA